MDNKAVILVGCGAQAKYCYEIFSIQDRPLARVFDPIGKKVGNHFYHLTIEAFTLDQVLKAIEETGQTEVAVCASDTALKKNLFSLLREASLASAIHPKSVIAGTSNIGRGVIINAGAVIQSNAQLGKGVMIHANTVVEHDCRVGDFVNLAMGSVLAGRVKVGEGSTIFAGVTVAPNITVGRNSIIGAGSLVLADVPDNTLAYGCPAVPIREINSLK